MTTMTNVDFELDQRTIDELTPPCESGNDTDPATRIAHWHTHCDCFPAHRLYCTPCAASNAHAAMVAVIVCRECLRTVRLLRIEPLR